MQRAKALACTLAKDNKPTCSGQVFVGIFFDGTGNNRDKDYVEPPPEKRKHSNIVRLFHTHRDEPIKGFLRYYIPGVGTSFPEIGDSGTGWSGTAGSAAAWKGENRIVWGLFQLLNAPHRFVHNNALLIQPDEAKTVVGNTRQQHQPRCDAPGHSQHLAGQAESGAGWKEATGRTDQPLGVRLLARRSAGAYLRQLAVRGVPAGRRRLDAGGYSASSPVSRAVRYGGLGRPGQPLRHWRARRPPELGGQHTGDSPGRRALRPFCRRARGPRLFPRSIRYASNRPTPATRTKSCTPARIRMSAAATRPAPSAFPRRKIPSWRPFPATICTVRP